jgi:regulator of sigma E protease
MQQEIYDSGWAQEKPNSGDMHSYPVHNAYFANWSIVPASIADVMFMGYDIPEAFIHRSKKRTEDCVIQGKDPVTLQEKIETAIKMNPQLDMNDLRLKMEKDIGVWITYVEEDDNVIPIDFPVGWSAGNTALHLACQHGAEEVYILGYDLSSQLPAITRWNFFGGFVRMLGEEESSKDPRSFEQAKLWKRMVITLAGVFVNYIVALSLLTILFSVGTNPIFVSHDDISKALKEQVISLEKIPNSPRAKIIYNKQIKKDFPDSLFFAATETIRISKALVVKVGGIPGDLIRKQTLPEGMMGPVGIAYVVKEVIPQGLNSVIKLIAMLSLSLAVMNLLPIPALDGGRFFMQIIEMIIRRPIPQKLEGLVNLSGFFLLIGLLALVTWNDIVSWLAR